MQALFTELSFLLKQKRSYEIDFDQMSLSSNDEYPELLISDLHSVLQPSELTLLSQFVFKGMSIADIAEKSGVSRQAINRKKLSILKN